MSRYLHQTDKKDLKKKGIKYFKKMEHLTLSATSPWQRWLGIRLTGVGSLCTPFARWRKSLLQRSLQVNRTLSVHDTSNVTLWARVPIAKLFYLWNIRSFNSLQISALWDSRFPTLSQVSVVFACPLRQYLKRALRKKQDQQNQPI